MKLYRIKNWNFLYENNRTRELKKLDWFPMSNKQDGDGYTAIMEHKNGASILGAFVACAQIASRCDPRGTLIRDGQKPHNARSLSRMSRIPEAIIQEMLDVCSGHDVNWLETLDVPALSAGECDTKAAPSCDDTATGCLEGKGKKEGKEKNVFSPDVFEVLKFLNETAGKGFREVEASLNFIAARLKEPGVNLEGVKKMVKRQCILWTGTKMQDYLRPETLFNQTKFNSYYAAKDQPVDFRNEKPDADDSTFL